MLKRMMACSALMMLAAAGAVHVESQEAVANGNEAAIDANLSEQKIQAINAAFTSIVTSMTTAMRTCGNSRMVYAPGATGANASGCVSPIVAGTVSAFQLSACPTGWTALTTARGRVIIGVGTLGSDSYALNGTGGASQRTLAANNVPAHTHPLRSVGLRMVRKADGDKHGWFQGLKDESAYDSDTRPDVTTKASAGGNQPFDNRQAYLALLYCVKN